jgi:hypothetical protein
MDATLVAISTSRSQSLGDLAFILGLAVLSIP